MRFPDRASAVTVKHGVGRAVLLIVIVALHLLVVVWLAGRPRPQAKAVPAVLNVFTAPLANGHGASAPFVSQKVASLPRPTPIVIARRPSPPVTSAPSSTAKNTAPKPDAAPGGCALARAAGDAIGHDVAAMAELDALPSTIRTSADAVMLWNGEWLDGGAMDGEGDTGAVRRAVEQVVADAPVECRKAETSGPVFIPIPERDHTVMIVIGSGIWRWADLLPFPEACTPASASPCPRVEAPLANDERIK